MFCGVATVTRRVMSKTRVHHSLHERDQFGVHLIAMRPAQTVWTAGDFGELGVLDHLGLPARRRGRRQRMRSASPWIIRVGTVFLATSFRKILHPGIDALQRFRSVRRRRPRFQLSSRTRSLTSVPPVTS